MCNSQTTLSLPLDSSSPQLILCLKQALFLLPVMFRGSVALWSLFPKTVTATQPCDHFFSCLTQEKEIITSALEQKQKSLKQETVLFFWLQQSPSASSRESLCAGTLTSLKCTQRPTRLKNLCVQSDQSNSCEVAFGTCYLFLSTTSTACESTVFWLAAPHTQRGKRAWGGALAVADIHSHWHHTEKGETAAW